MNRAAKISIMLAVVAASFGAGAWWNRRAAGTSAAMERKPLYYACPMHPGYKSDRPGDAPCCGMRLEPVYANQPAAPSSGANPGSVYISSAQQQISGVRLETAVRQSARGTLRTTGRVAPDENRLYRINASTEMWIRAIYPPTSGSYVQKDERLCGFYTTNFLTAAQSYIYILDACDRLREAGQNSGPQTASNDLQLRQAVELLQNLGVSQAQIQEMAATRKPSALVDVRSPVAGYLLSRKVTLGQWLGPGSEMYEIADLSHIWIYADLFASEARGFRPGALVSAWAPTLKLSFQARVSDTPPAFDPATRVMRVRLEADNPGRVLWPGMFVDVELPVNFEAGISVPSDAVIHSGRRSTVYVAGEAGYFEPRIVETGWTFGGRVQITKGLEEGEKLVVSGNFLVDSETRMKAAMMAVEKPKAPPASTVKDAVCGMDVNPAKAAGKSGHKGKTYYFCNRQCKEKFDKDPGHYLKKAAGGHMAAVMGPGQ